jgi:hypothetical protein
MNMRALAAEAIDAKIKYGPPADELFWPIVACPAIALATADLPIGQK